MAKRRPPALLRQGALLVQLTEAHVALVDSLARVYHNRTLGELARARQRALRTALQEQLRRALADPDGSSR